MAAAAAPNDENDRTGFINRIFKFVVAVRDVGQNLKQRNRKLYYWVKYLLIDLIFALIIILSVFF